MADDETFNDTEHKHQSQKLKKLAGNLLNEKLNEFTTLELGSNVAGVSISIDDLLIPHFQRTEVSYLGLIPTEDSDTAFIKLVKCLEMRKRYMIRSCQSFSTVVAEFLDIIGYKKTMESVKKEILARCMKKESTASGRRNTTPPHIEDPWNVQLLPNLGYTCKIEKGIIHVYEQSGTQQQFLYPSFEEHVADLRELYGMVCYGPVRSFSDKRLNFLRSRFNIHINLNEVYELAAMAEAPRRDFYNVLKVDTHIHAAACMTRQKLLSKIEFAALQEPNQEVLPGKNKGDPPITLTQLFKNLHLDPRALSVDALDVHADRSTMNRFDRFDNLYNVAGESDLRKVFLKPTKNLVKGRYFAELINESLGKKESLGYNYAELRISTGASLAEWKDLANWAKEFNVYSDNNRWVLQIPRNYAEKRKTNQVTSFEKFISDAFLPIFLATSDPESYPEIANFLEYVIAMDSVSDESVDEVSLLSIGLPRADAWTSEENPPYAYYLYYMHANIAILNQFRQSRGMNIFKLRPHSGESGSPVHLASAFLLAENISHGIQLTLNPALEYLYFLAQIPIALSPLSNNALFLPYLKHPLKQFLSEGIPVTVSTDDPLMFHLTSEPLAEEYAVAAQVFGLSACDQCELAKNSVLMSGFPENVKSYWLGENYHQPGIAGNNIGLTNVPDVRVAYRFETHLAELFNLCIGHPESQEEAI